MNVQGYIRVPLERSGEDAYNVVPSTNVIYFGEGETEEELRITATKGSERVYLSITDMTWSEDLPDGVTMGQRTSDNGVIIIPFIRTDADTVVSGTFNYVVTVDEVEYPFTLTFHTPVDGDSSLQPMFDVNPNLVFTDTLNTYTLRLYLDEGTEHVLFILSDTGGTLLNNAAIEYSYTTPTESDPYSDIVITRVDTTQEVSGDLQFRLRLYSNMRVTRSVVITASTAPRGEQGEPGEPGKDGEDAISVDTSADTLVFGEDELSKSFTITAYQGTTKIDLTTEDIAFTRVPSYTIGLEANDGVITVTITRGEGVTTADAIDYTIYAGGLTFPKVIYLEYIVTVTYYEIVLDTDSLHYNAAALAYTPSTFTIRVQKVHGDERADVTFSGRLAGIKPDEYGDVYPMTNVESYTFEPVNAYTSVLIEITAVEGEQLGSSLERVIYPTSSFMPRRQNWEDCADGFYFCQGEIGEQFIDFVDYNGGLFQCRNHHTKSDERVPIGDNGDEWWQSVSYFDSIATNVLLADTAKIDNLYVDDVFMINGNTAIWINPNHRGIKINNINNLSDGADTTRNNITDGDWINPTTSFDAEEIPDPNTLYGTGGSTGSITLDAEDQFIINTEYPEGERGEARTNALVSASCSGLGAETLVTFNFATCTFSIMEGMNEGTEQQGSESTATLQLRIATSRGNLMAGPYQVLFTAYPNGDTPGEISTTTRGAFTAKVTSSSSGNLYIGLFLTGYYLRYNAYCSHSAITATYSVTTSQYISQYGADGIFIGLKSDTFFRIKVSESDTQYKMLSDGCGIDINNDRALQYRNSYAMPLGGALLLANITSSGSITYWTFDGSVPRVEKPSSASTGVYWLYFPSAWGDIFGEWDSDTMPQRIVCTVTPSTSSGGYQASVVVGGYSGYWGYARIYVTDSTATLVDCDIAVRVDFMGSLATTTLQVASDSEINEQQETE